MLLALRAAANELPGCRDQRRHAIELDAATQRRFRVKALALDQDLLEIGLNRRSRGRDQGFARVHQREEVEIVEQRSQQTEREHQRIGHGVFHAVPGSFVRPADEIQETVGANTGLQEIQARVFKNHRERAGGGVGHLDRGGPLGKDITSLVAREARRLEQNRIRLPGNPGRRDVNRVAAGQLAIVAAIGVHSP